MCLKVETSSGKIYRSAKFCACMLLHLPGSFHAVLLVFHSYFLLRKLSYFQMESDISQQEIIKTLQTQLTNAREDLQEKVFPLHTLSKFQSYSVEPNLNTNCSYQFTTL